MKRRPHPEHPWRKLRLAGFTLLALGLLASILIAAGAFDPRPLGGLISAHPGATVVVGAGESTLQALTPVTPAAFSVRGTGYLVEGEVDSGYGLAAGNGRRWLVVALSPIGYAAVWEELPSGEREYHLPWQPWPHVRPGSNENEIWLDIVSEGDDVRVSARINREQLWEGESRVEVDSTARWAGSFGASASVSFGETRLYGPDSPAD